MNLRLEENYIPGIYTGMYVWTNAHAHLFPASFSQPAGPSAPIFFPCVLPSPPKAKPTSCAVFPIPRDMYHTLGTLPEWTLTRYVPTPSNHKPSPSDPVSRAPTESVSTTSPAIPEPKVSDDETFPSYGPFFWEISRLSLNLL